MSYRWETDRQLPAGARITVGDGRLGVLAPGGQLLHVAVLPPSEEERRQRERISELELRPDAASELRSLAALFPPPVMVDPGAFDRGFIHACGEFCRALNRRADELDGGVS